VKMGGKQDVVSFGPPVVLLGGFPLSMETDEFADMVADAAPQAWQRGLVVHRVTANGLDLTVGELLNHTAAAAVKPRSDSSQRANKNGLLGGDVAVWDVPVLFFSGIENDDIRSISKLIIAELFEETGQRAAMAKAVPPAIHKLAGQMFEEIRRDHTEAMAKLTELDSSRRG